MTVLLTRSAIDGAVDVDRALRVLEDGFRAPPPGRAPLRMAAGLPGPGTATCLMPGTLPGIPAYTVKVNAKFPDACPALRGVVCLHDLDSGELLALADSASITAWPPPWPPTCWPARPLRHSGSSAPGHRRA